MDVIAKQLHDGIVKNGWDATLDGTRVTVRKGGTTRVHINLYADGGKTVCRPFCHYSVVDTSGTYHGDRQVGYIVDNPVPLESAAAIGRVCDACTVMMCFDASSWNVRANSLDFKLFVDAWRVRSGEGRPKLFECTLRREGETPFAVVTEFELPDTVRRCETAVEFIAWAGRVAAATDAGGVVHMSAWKTHTALLLGAMERAVRCLLLQEQAPREDAGDQRNPGEDRIRDQGHYANIW